MHLHHKSYALKELVPVPYGKVYHVVGVKTIPGISVPYGLPVSSGYAVHMLLTCRAGRVGSHLDKLIVPEIGIVLHIPRSSVNNRLHAVVCLLLAKQEFVRIGIDVLKVMST